MHNLKIWPEYFKEVESGQKNFEYRLNDRDFKQGDSITLHEWDNTTEEIDHMGQKEAEMGEKKYLVKPGYVISKTDGSEARKRHTVRDATRKKYGKASEHLCWDCNLPAVEWHHVEYHVDGAYPVCKECHVLQRN